MGKYIYALIVIIFIWFAGSQIYTTFFKSKETAKTTRLACHKKSTTFERIYNKKLISQAIESIENGNVKTKYEMQFSKYVPSKMGQYFTIEQVDNDLQQILKSYKKGDQNGSTLLIDYFVYENDLGDPGKKTEEAKKYAGYIRMNFYLDNTKIYGVQIDFMDWQGKDINEKLHCAIESFMTLKNKISN